MVSIYFDSMTGNVRSFVEKLNYEGKVVEVVWGDEEVDENEQILYLTWTSGYGDVNDAALEFLEEHGDKLIGVCSSGNHAYGDNWCKAAEVIASDYNLDFAHKFAGQGDDSDVEVVRNFLNEFNESISK